MDMGNFLPKNPDMDGYGSGRTGWSGVGLRILPREGLYLHGHTQTVCAVDGRGNRHLSRPLSNPMGVFQGSSLGPLLFLIFANDLPMFAPDAHVVQYADDTQILVSGKKVPSLSSLLLRNRL